LISVREYRLPKAPAANGDADWLRMVNKLTIFRPFVDDFCAISSGIALVFS
jgi:hypothetical protein